MQFEVQGQFLDEASLPDFLVKNLNGKPLQNLLQELKEARFNRPRTGDWERVPELLIQDVLLTNSQQSIFGKDAPAALEPDFAGTIVGLTIKGSFRDKQRRPLEKKAFAFTLEPDLVQQTFVGTEPHARVLLDHSLLLEVESVSATEIKAMLRTKQIPDLYLKGMHRLSVETDKYYTDSLIRIGDPAPVTSLLPAIQSVEVMRDKNHRPLHVRLRGKNFMLYPKFSFATIDGDFGFGYRTEAFSDGSFESIIHVPNPDLFDRTPTHSIVYARPFGSAFKTFGGS